MLQHNRALRFLVEGQHRMPAELEHRLTQAKASLSRHHIAMKGLSRQRTRHRAVRADQPQIKPQLPRNRQSKRMPPPSHQHDFNPRRVSPPQRLQVGIRNLKFRIEQRAVDISCQQPDRRGLRASAIGLQQGTANFLHTFIVTHVILSEA